MCNNLHMNQEECVTIQLELL